MLYCPVPLIQKVLEEMLGGAREIGTGRQAKDKNNDTKDTKETGMWVSGEVTQRGEAHVCVEELYLLESLIMFGFLSFFFSFPLRWTFLSIFWTTWWHHHIVHTVKHRQDCNEASFPPWFMTCAHSPRSSSWYRCTTFTAVSPSWFAMDSCLWSNICFIFNYTGPLWSDGLLAPANWRISRWIFFRLCYHWQFPYREAQWSL